MQTPKKCYTKHTFSFFIISLSIFFKLKKNIPVFFLFFFSNNHLLPNIWQELIRKQEPIEKSPGQRVCKAEVVKTGGGAVFDSERVTEAIWLQSTNIVRAWEMRVHVSMHGQKETRVSGWSPTLTNCLEILFCLYEYWRR